MNKIHLLIALSVLTLTEGHAVILFDDPDANTTAPEGSPAESGWHYQGDWGGNLGTPISPHFFISAGHFGVPGPLSYGGSIYPLIGVFTHPGSDLLICKVDGTFPDFAPLYSKRDETGGHLVVIGRGTLRGSEVSLDGSPRGWKWGGGGPKRWGENDIADIVLYGGHDLLYATFDQHVAPNDHPNEAHLSAGDSGGAVFLNDGGTWKVAGINFAVDDLYTAPSEQTRFNAAIFDARGFYTPDPDNPSMFIQIDGPNPVPTGFYASRISSELAWIASVVSDPQVGWEGNYLTLTYWRLTVPSTDVVYEVDQSSDLGSWGPATTQDEVVSSAGDFEQIKAKIDPGMADHLFVKLKVTRPAIGATNARPKAAEGRARLVPLLNH
jgi:hypothetical protein